jgi:poly [ADP-ribose] polymerase 6/8
MGVGAGPEYELTQFPETVDLLISTAFLALNSAMKEHVFKPFPERFQENGIIDYTKMLALIQYFPSVKQMAKLNLKKDFTPFAYYFFRWLLFSNASHIQLTTIEEIKQLTKLVITEEPKFVFKYVSLPPAKEFAFQTRKKNQGSTYGFHGSPNGNWHSILRNFLAVFSGTKMQLHGAAHGKGIYFAENQITSLGYCTNNIKNWSKSILGETPQFMLIAEVINDAKKDHQWCFTVEDASAVATRYLLVL